MTTTITKTPHHLLAPRRLTCLTALALTVAGCSDDGTSDELPAADDGGTTGTAADDDGDDGVDDDGGTTGEDPVPVDPNAPTYHADVAPILSRHCNGCHVEGGIAPFQFASYVEAVAFAPVIAPVVEAGVMPPWPPGGDTPPLAHARTMPEADIATLAAWVEAGTPEGDPATAAPLPPPETVELVSIDASGDIGVDYVPDDSVTDDYQCFMIDPGIAADGVLRGYRFTPGNGKVVHHVLSTLYGPESRDAIAAQDEADAGPGWSCGGGYSNIPGANALSPLGGWVPGVTAANYPQGTGVPVPAGGVVVVQIHYNLAGGTDPDRTSLDLSMYPPDEADAVHRLGTIGMPWPLFKIPAGESEYVTSRDLPITTWGNAVFPDDDDAYVLGVAGHMHLLGTAIEVTRIRDGERQTILEIPAWDFDWQGSYTLVDPMPVVATDHIEIQCTYDNSAEHRAAQGMGPPVDVTWGEGTTDEMCLAYLQIVDELP